MAQSKIHQNQLQPSTTPGSFITSDASNVWVINAPTTGADRIPFYDDSATAAGFLTLGTNLSITGTTLNASAGAGGYSTIQEEGSDLTVRTKLNFIGGGFTAADDAGNSRTNVTLASQLNTFAAYNTNGIFTQTAAGTYTGRTITGTTNRLTVTNGDGVSGNPTLDISTSYVGQATITTLGTISTGTWNGTAIGPTFGGTGLTSYTTGDLIYASATNTLAKLAAGASTTYLKGGTSPSWATLNIAALSDASSVVQTSGTFTLGGTYTFSNNVVLNGTPSLSTHAVNKGYVDGLLNGISWKNSVDVATTANITLSGEQTIDGVLTSSSRVLVRAQTAPAENGIYISGAGSWTRATDMDAWAEVPAAAVFVEAGTTLADTAWVCTSNDGGTLNTTAITWVKFSSASGVIDGSGAANKVAYWSDTDTLTSTTNFHFSGTQLAVGTATPATSAMFTTKGTGTGNSTFGYVHQNSSGTQVFRIADDGTAIQGTGTTLSIYNGGIESNSILYLTSAPTSSVQISGSWNPTNTNTALSITSATKTYTSGSFTVADFTDTFAPTSGTGVFTGLTISNTINQTGGANGVTRGLRIVPTLTAAADYRGVEITANSSHYALYTTAGKVRFDLGSDAQGDLLVRGSGGELTRLAAGSTSGHVLTSNGSGAAPSWQAAAGGVTVTRAYKTGATTDTFDLDSGTAVTDIDGNNVAFTTSGISADKIFVVRNGVVLSQSGTVTRDYTLNTSTGVLVLAYAMTSGENLMVYKIV